jgi:serine/threonine protein phosphatase PrpC
MLSDSEIEERLRGAGVPDQAARALVRDANNKGGLDNITVVLLTVDDDEGSDTGED